MGETDVRAAERRFFNALLAADAAALEEILAEDFVLIDVLTGSEVERADLIGVVGSGHLRFDEIQLEGSRVRIHGTTAIVTGKTDLAGAFGEAPFAASSRYTHVFVEERGRWRMVAAQGTRIAGE